MELTASQLARYKVVYLPFQVVMRESVAKLLRQYVQNGGTLVADARTATINEPDFGYLESTGAGLTEVFGVRRTDFYGEITEYQIQMVVKLGTRMINSFLTGIDRSREFINYGILGHPEVMGFISGYSDTAWMHRKQHGDPVEYILKKVRTRSEQNEHMPVMFHDWAAWQKSPDKELSHVRKIAETGRELGYTLVTHMDCYNNKPLWM